MSESDVSPDDDRSFLAIPGEMAELIRTRDWSVTQLGPIAGWPQSLRTTVSLCLASNFPINIIWGPDCTQIYNDGYRVLCGERHPAALGMDYRVCWASAWPELGAPFAAARAGHASFLENQRMFLFRNGYLEETFFTLSPSPIRDESGGIGGVFHPVAETTATMVGARRTRAVRDLTASLAAAQTRADVVERTIATVSEFAFDLPFVLLYERDDDGALRRVGHTGFVLPAPFAPDVLDPAAWPLADIGDTVLEMPGLIGAFPCGPYPEAPEVTFAIPVHHTGSDQPVALLLTAASARLPLDDACRGFIDLVSAAFGAALGRVMRLEEERERLASLAALDRAKTRFFSNVSHEFRTPLTLMLGPIEEVLGNGALDVRQHALLDIAQRNAQRLLKLVNGLLDFTRMEDGRDTALFVPTDLAQFTVELASNFRAACERGGLCLEVDCPPLDQPVWVERDSWEKIVLNLLSNAFKFTLAGAIRVSLTRVPDGVELCVADSGIGIPPEHVGRVFERFHRIDGQRGRSVEGTGIGLALVKEMVAQHGGTIGVDSRKGEGTTFRIRLPLGHAHLPPDQLASGAAFAATMHAGRALPFVDEALHWIPGQAAALAALPDTVPVNTVKGRGTILLAEDNADMRAYVERVLDDAGYHVTAVADGVAALLALRDGPVPDLLLSDVMMPEMNGFDLLAAVRADARNSDVVVILLSARAGQEARVEGLQAGADDYLVKPFGARELIARVDGAIRLARQRRAAQLTSLFAQTATGVLQAGLDGRVVRVNPRLCTMLAMPAAALEGNALSTFIHPDDRAALDAVLLDLRTSGEPARLDVRLQGASAVILWATLALTPELANDTLLIVVLDISDRIAAEENLRIADRSKDEFLAMLAHELRNPLAPISAAAELMSRVQLDDIRLKRTSAVIARQVRHMTELVDDLLDVSRVTRGLVLVDKTTQDMKAVLTHAVEQVRPLLDAQRHALSIRITPATANVLGDHKRLVQVVGNLLNNAVKYTPPCGRIELELAVEPDRVIVAISDNGIGIPHTLQPRVFDLFAQAARALDRSQGGLGLGLGLARTLAQLHGGDITCFSDGPSCGSRFTITLPRDVAHSEAGAIDSAGGAPAGAVRVLVVDDNVDAASMISMLLESFGYHALVEHSAQAGLARAQAERPDVCILDIGLPEMDGNELARRLRADPATADMVLIALTGYSQKKDRERSYSAGFDHHFAKPANIDKLAEVLVEVTPRGRN